MSALAFASPGRPRRRRSKILGAVIGFVAAASLVAIAAWIVIPNSPGIGYGKGKAPVAGLVLDSVQVTDAQLQGNEIGPNESGLILARWHNPASNPPVSIIKVEVPNGSQITKVGEPSCTASSPADFTTVPGTVPPGTWTVAPDGERMTSLTLNTTATFPSCLASSTFSIAVLATAVT